LFYCNCALIKLALVLNFYQLLCSYSKTLRILIIRHSPSKIFKCLQAMAEVVVMYISAKDHLVDKQLAYFIVAQEWT